MTDPLGLIGRSFPTPGPAGGRPASGPAPGGPSFADSLRGEIDRVNSLQQDAKKAVEVVSETEKPEPEELSIDPVAEDRVEDDPDGAAAEDGPSSSSERAEVALEEGDDHPVLKALVNLLDRKQIVSKDELRVEVELLRRRSHGD